MCSRCVVVDGPWAVVAESDRKTSGTPKPTSDRLKQLSPPERPGPRARRQLLPRGPPGPVDHEAGQIARLRRG